MALLSESGADLFNRACFNYSTLGDLYKSATYDAILHRATGGIGSGVFDPYEDAQKLAPIFNVVTDPNRDTVALYELHYRSFLEIYPRMKSWRAI
jgi:hypothetical protein